MRTVRPVRLTVTRYRLPDGTVCRSTDPGATKFTEKTDAYYARLPDPATGKRKPVALDTTDEAQAWINLQALLRKRADRAAGITDDVTDQLSRPIAEHLEDWLADLATGDVSEHYARVTRKRMAVVIAAAGWRQISEITAASARAALNRLQRSGGHRGQGRNNTTRNHYARRLKQFTRWLLLSRRIREDPLLSLEMLNEETDSRHERREPTDAELGLLFAYLEGGEAATHYGMTGAQRALGYRVLMATGLRLAELCSLSRESFDLDGNTVTVRAGYSKHRRRDTLPLPEWLVRELREWFGSGGQCWPYPAKGAERVIQADLAACGVEYETEGPEGPLFFDHHSFRVHFISWLARQAGISPKVLLELARHSDARLTLHIYAKIRLRDQHAAIEDLPRPEAARKGRRRKQA